MTCNPESKVTFLFDVECLRNGKGKGKRYVDLYSALDDKYLVHKTLRHGSHSLTCKQHHVCL